MGGLNGRCVRVWGLTEALDGSSAVQGGVNSVLTQRARPTWRRHHTVQGSRPAEKDRSAAEERSATKDRPAREDRPSAALVPTFTIAPIAPGVPTSKPATPLRRVTETATPTIGLLPEPPDNPRPPRRRTPAWVRTTHTLLVTADALVAPAMSALVAATGTDLGPQPRGFLLPVAIGTMWLVALALAGGYDARRATDFREESRSVAMAAVGLAAMIAVATQLLDVRLPRLVFVLSIVGLPAVSLIARRAAHAWVAAARRRGDLLERTLVVGRIDRAEALATTLADTPETGYDPVGIAAYPRDGEPLPPTGALGVPVAPAHSHLMSSVDGLNVDVVLLAAHSDLAGMPLRRLTWALEERGIDLVIHPGLVDVTRPRLAVQPCSGLPLVSVRRPGPQCATRLCKAAYDRVLASLLLLALSPVLLLTALAIKCTSRGPVIYLDSSRRS